MKDGDIMSKKIVAIGGGENGRYLGEGKYYPYETEPMDKEIIKLTKKEKPNFLFLAHSQSSLEVQTSYFETMKKNIGYGVSTPIPGISINGKEFNYDSNLTGGNIIKVEAPIPAPNAAEIELKYKVTVNS